MRIDAEVARPHGAEVKPHIRMKRGRWQVSWRGPRGFGHTYRVNVVRGRWMFASDNWLYDRFGRAGEPEPTPKPAEPVRWFVPPVGYIYPEEEVGRSLPRFG